MKKLLFFIILFIISFGAKAQYPLPSTTVFGNLTVQDTVTFTGGYVPFSSNVLNFGYSDLPFTGAGGAYGDGVFFNGIADFSAVGFPNHTWAAGYLSNGGVSFVQVDTTAIRLRVANGFDFPERAGAHLEMYRDTSISGYRQLFSLYSDAPYLGNVGVTSQINDNKHQLSLFANSLVVDEANSWIKIDTEYVAITASEVKIESTNNAGLRSTISVSEYSAIIDNYNQDTIMISNADGIIISPVNHVPVSGDVLTTIDNRGTVIWQTPAYSSGYYTPTATSITNIDTSTPHATNWSRVENIVTVAGAVTITTNANGLTQLGISLPVASDFTTIYDASGNVIATGATTHSGVVYSNVANNYVVIEFRHNGTVGADDFRFTYSYEVL